MQLPKALKKGDTIAITCPSGYIDKAVVLEAKQQLEAWGFKVLVGATVAKSDNYFSAPDELRLKDLQKYLDDPGVAAILMGRGGYGMSRIIDGLDFSAFARQPKWICGFSDITVIHNHIQRNYGVATLHGPMCSSFTKENAKKDFLKAYKQILTGKPVHYSAPANKYNVPGKACGILVGGNLAMLAHLSGSSSAMNAHGKILFIEDIGEHLYNIDRMLYNLKRAGAFDQLLAVVCGGFTDLEDTTRPFGQDIYQILNHHFGTLGIPLAFDMPSGHIDENWPLCLGGRYEVEVKKQGTTLHFLY
ncbi:MAG: LD-carboxypeptidase [Taibaiella sp.]|nr:LD-carboxypeptidase [Taibaiella sp.]